MAADDLLDALSRRDSRWAASPTSWIFRGQSDSRWELVPSALRTNAEFSYGPNSFYKRGALFHEQITAEATLVRTFLSELDRNGIALPSDASWRWNDMMKMFDDLLNHGKFAYWPPTDLIPLFALAQHSGVPTRLLDWTARPLVAAYFAAVDAARAFATGMASDTHLAVWALRTEQARAVVMVDIEKPRQPEIQLVGAPRSTNPNLHAQDGRFTLLVDNTIGWNSPAAVPSLDGLMRARLEEAAQAGREIRSPPLRKLELPISEAGALLRLLSAEWVSASSIYPGMRGVVEAIRERGLWDTAAQKVS